ncbi:helix-turn-helix domain-containing protein [Streptomyces sp. NPDC048188]|uniref:helix-turn-helix domain-containing protein n=1 Tax=Streptomyces sp. NPDC048188 TaxID=3155749 RepID=UPI003425AA73
MIVFLLLTGAAVVAWFYAKSRARHHKAVRDARRAILAGKAAKQQEEARRPLAQRVHALLPEAAVARLLAWKPEARPRPTVRIARRGVFGGRYERINPAQHVMVVGFTGSGKSSALRVLAAWALANPRWSLEAWDGKWGASVRAYRGKCPVLDTMPAIEARLSDLVERELPARALLAEPPHLAIIMDESRLLNELSAGGMRNLVTVIQTGRELGVHLWFGLQDPKTDSVPSEIRDQFSCKLVHQLQTREAAQVALKELASSAGWSPHRLMRSGQMLIWEPRRAMSAPRVVFGLWLSAGRLAALERRGPYTAPEFARPVSLTKASARPSVRAESAGHAHTRTPGRTADALTSRQAQALAALDVADRPMGAADLARELGVERNRAHDVLTQLRRRGLVAQTPDGFTIPLHAEKD